MDTKPPTRVRITRVSNPYLWYADRIGEEFDVIKSIEAGYTFEVRTEKTTVRSAYLVFADDCEPVDGSHREGSSVMKLGPLHPEDLAAHSRPNRREEVALDLLAEALPLLNPRRDRDPAAAHALFVKVRASLDRDALSANPPRIRVTKSSRPGYWYEPFIGQEFNVVKAKPGVAIVHEGLVTVEHPEGTPGWTYSVSAADCEPVDDLPKASEAQS